MANMFEKYAADREAEQKKIEAEIAAFEKNIYGDQARKDSLDSLRVQTVTDKKARKSARKSSSSTSVRSAKKSKTKTSKSSSSSTARVSARRERH